MGSCEPILHCLLILNKVLLVLALHLANIHFVLLLELVPSLYHHRQLLPQFMVLPLRTLQELKQSLYFGLLCLEFIGFALPISEAMLRFLQFHLRAFG